MQDDRLESALGYALVRAFRHVNRAHNRALLPFELSAEQAHILLVLWLDGPMKIGDLQRSLVLSSGTLTGAIDRMEKGGLVRRVADRANGRAGRIEPAPMPARRRRAIEETLERTEEETFSALSARERRELFRFLVKIAPR